MLDKEFFIGNFLVGNYGEPFIIAEAGSNHNQSLDTARQLIEAAAKAGAGAVKFQLFIADKLYPREHKLYNIFKSIELNRDWIPKLVKHASECDVQFLASAFDTDSVDLLDQSGVGAFKIASSEAVNFSLLAHTVKKGRPIIISSGMCDMIDVIEAVNFCESQGASSIALLQCGAVYPLEPEQAHLRVMDSFRSVFTVPVGYSDHTLGLSTPVAAVSRGACIIEKHFTLDKASEGPDHFYALDPAELTEMIKMVKEAHAALGSHEKFMLHQEREFGRRKGLYTAFDLKKGDILDEKKIEIKQPAVGLRERHLDKIVGLKVVRNLSKGTPLNWDNISF